jgi:hypothetical protein
MISRCSSRVLPTLALISFWLDPRDHKVFARTAEKPPSINITKVREPVDITTMSYYFENRLKRHESGASVATYLYSGDGLKRVEDVDGAYTTLVWDGQDYLQGRS